MSMISSVILPGIGPVCPDAFPEDTFRLSDRARRGVLVCPHRARPAQLDWDIAAARTLIATRPRAPRRLDRDWLAFWLSRHANFSADHLEHIPTQCLDEPGVLVEIRVGPPAGQPVPFLILIDGTHRAARRLRDRQLVWAYLLTETVQRSICRYRNGGHVYWRCRDSPGRASPRASRRCAKRRKRARTCLSSTSGSRRRGLARMPSACTLTPKPPHASPPRRPVLRAVAIALPIGAPTTLKASSSTSCPSRQDAPQRQPWLMSDSSFSDAQMQAITGRRRTTGPCRRTRLRQDHHPCRPHRATWLENAATTPAVLTVSFTTEAARRLRHEVERQLGERAADVTIITLHALGRRVINTWSMHLGYDDRPIVLHHGRSARLACLFGRNARLESRQRYRSRSSPPMSIVAGFSMDAEARQAIPSAARSLYEERLDDMARSTSSPC